MDLLQRALDILEFVCVSGSASADETSEALGIPKSTVYRLLAALQKRDYIRHTSPNCYEVGPRLLMLQGITERQNRLIQSARPHLRQLSQSTGQTAHLAVLSASRLSYVDTVMGESGLSIYPSPTSPLHCTSLGKVLLAFLPQPLRETTIDSLTLEKRTPNTITTIAALVADLEQVRNRGYALDNEEFNLGVRCIGAPVRNAAGDVIAAISISGLAARFTGDAFPAWASAVCETARCISRDLGYPMVLSPAITVTDQPFYQGVCKAAMELVGKPVGEAREPMENLTDDEKQELRGILRMMGASVVC